MNSLPHPPSSSHHDLYMRGLEAYTNGNNDHLRKISQSPDLELAARKLLLARQLLKRQKKGTAARLLESIASTDPLFSGEKHLLLASCLSYLGEWERAAYHNQQAISFFERTSFSRGRFLARYNLSVDYSRIGLKKIASLYLIEADRCAVSPSHRCLVLRAQASELSAQGHFADAAQVLSRAFALMPSLSDVDRLNLRLVAADTYFRAGRIHEAHTILCKLRTSKMSRDRARIAFDHELLGRLCEVSSSPPPALGSTPACVEESPEYRLKWNIIRHAQTGDKEAAHGAWAELHAMFPSLYLKEFGVSAEAVAASPFMSFLGRVLIRATMEPLNTTSALRGRLGDLYRALAESEIPLRKEALIEQVWQVPYSPAFDSRFYKMMERLRTEGNCRIVSENRAYRLIRTG